MLRTIRKLFGASGVLMLVALSASYYGYEQGAAHKASDANALASQFAADPGDGWMLFGGFLMIVALSIAFAGAMLWMQERKRGS